MGCPRGRRGRSRPRRPDPRALTSSTRSCRRSPWDAVEYLEPTPASSSRSRRRLPTTRQRRGSSSSLTPHRERGCRPRPGPWAAPPRFRVVLAGGGSRFLVLLVLGVGLAAFRYLPALDEARALRADLEPMVERARRPDSTWTMKRSTSSTLGLTARLALIDSRAPRRDPLIAVARALPPMAANVRGADAIVAAAGLLDAAAWPRDRAALRRDQGRPGRSRAMPPPWRARRADGHVADRAPSAAASVADARSALAAVPDGLDRSSGASRDAMVTRIERYSPMLDSYLAFSERLPAILGWYAPRRYLVLTQDPAELRPTGGFTGSYGIVAFDRGRIDGAHVSRTSAAGPSVGLPVYRAAAGARRLPARRRSSPGSSPTPIGRRTSPRAPETRSACTTNESGDAGSTASSGSRPTPSTSS